MQNCDLVDSVQSELHRQRPQEKCTVTFVVRLYTKEQLVVQLVAYHVCQHPVLSVELLCRPFPLGSLVVVVSSHSA